jgi:hypothetical protein
MTDSEFKTQVVITLRSISRSMGWFVAFAGSAWLVWLLGVDK